MTEEAELVVSATTSMGMGPKQCDSSQVSLAKGTLACGVESELGSIL